jgi:hypothetical protein
LTKEFAAKEERLAASKRANVFARQLLRGDTVF